MLSSAYPYLFAGLVVAGALLLGAWIRHRIAVRRPRSLNTIRDFQGALRAISPEHHRRRESAARRRVAAEAARRSVRERRWTSA